jgi:acyl-CoA thioesterase-1
MPADFETEFRRMYTRVADDFSATFIPSLLEGVAGDSTLNLADGIHPNENGAIKISKTLWPHLLLILKTGDGDPQ